MLDLKHKRIYVRNFFAKQFLLPRLKSKIGQFAPKKPRAKVLILNLNSNPVRAPGKVNPAIFFPPFSGVLAACGVSTAYVNDKEGMERELSESGRIPVVLVNLIHELHAEKDKYDIPEKLATKFSAIFNRHNTAKIIGDKIEANIFFTKHNISMPSLRPDAGKKIFSNTRFGSHDKVLLYESIDNADNERYNTEFIDTTVDFRDKTYYTSIRLNCIGAHIAQINVRASDKANGNPSVTGVDTPLDRTLLEYFHSFLVAPRLLEFISLAKQIESVLGPGFYTHDTLVERDSGQIYLSETGFKFYSEPYANHIMDVIGDRNFLTGAMDMDTYAAYSASVFVTYCAGKGFI